MQYCLNIQTKYKIGSGKRDTKLLTKKAYSRKLPPAILNKSKTGWTVPIGHWLKANVNKELNDFYNSGIGEGNEINRVTLNSKVGKSLIPGWAYKSWKEMYKIKY